MPSYKELMLAQKVAKKTKKRQRKLAKSLQALKVRYAITRMQTMHSLETACLVVPTLNKSIISLSQGKLSNP